MNGEIKATAKVGIVRLGVVLAIALLIAGAVFVSPLLKKTTVNKGALAFGKLPASGIAAEAESVSARPALGVPAGDAYFEPVFEYEWTGGAWPDFAARMAVYRSADKIGKAGAQALAGKFGLTGEPEPDEPIDFSEPGRGATSGGVPTQVEPAPGGAGEPSFSAEEPGGPPAIQPEEPQPEPPPEVGRESLPYRSYRFYDRTTGKRLEIFETDGRFSYVAERAWLEAEKNAGGRPSDAAAKGAAVRFLEEKGLLPDGYTGPFVVDTGVVGSVAIGPDGAVSSEPIVDEPRPVEPPYVAVQFGRKLGGLDLVEITGEPNRYVVSVTVGPSGRILDVSGEIPTFLEKSEYPLLGPAAAFSQIKKSAYGGVRPLGGQPIPMDAPARMEPAEPPVEPENPAPGRPVEPEPIKVELGRIKLAYAPVIGQDGLVYYQPAYVFSGRVAASSGAGGDYKVAVPAVAPKYILPASRSLP